MRSHQRLVVITLVLAVVLLVAWLAYQQRIHRTSQRYLSEARTHQQQFIDGVAYPNYSEAVDLYTKVPPAELSRADLLYLLEAYEQLGQTAE